MVVLLPPHHGANKPVWTYNHVTWFLVGLWVLGNFRVGYTNKTCLVQFLLGMLVMWSNHPSWDLYIWKSDFTLRPSTLHFTLKCLIANSLLILISAACTWHFTKDLKGQKTCFVPRGWSSCSIVFALPINVSLDLFCLVSLVSTIPMYLNCHVLLCSVHWLLTASTDLCFWTDVIPQLCQLSESFHWFIIIHTYMQPNFQLIHKSYISNYAYGQFQMWLMGHFDYFFISIANMKYRRKLKLVVYVSDNSYLLFACLEKFICVLILLVIWIFVCD